LNVFIKILANLILGAFLLTSLLGSAFSDNYVVISVTLALAALFGFMLSYYCTKNDKKLYLAFSASYIAVPTVFIASSCNNSPDCTAMYIITWASVLAFIFITSSIGGFYASKKH